MIIQRKAVVTLAMMIGMLLILFLGWLLASFASNTRQHSTAALTDVKIQNYYWDGEVVESSVKVGINGNESSRQIKDLLVLDITVVNRSKFSIPLLDCVIVDANQNVFRTFPSAQSIEKDENLLSATIPSHEVISGKRAFIVPKGAMGLTLKCGYDIVVNIN